MSRPINYADAVAMAWTEMQGHAEVCQDKDHLADVEAALALLDKPVGEMGLSFNEVGSIVQSMAKCIVDRGEYTEEEVLAALKDFDEMSFWDHIGGCIDQLEVVLFSYPDAARPTKDCYGIHNFVADDGWPGDDPMDGPAHCTECGAERIDMMPPAERCERCRSPMSYRKPGRCVNADCSKWEGPE